MLILYSRISPSLTAFSFGNVFVGVIVLIVCLVVFGITFFWSLRIFKIRGVAFHKIVSAGFISFCASCILCALLRSIFVALAFYFPVLMNLIGRRASGSDLIFTTALFFVLHLLIDFLLVVYYLKIPWKRSIAPSILTEIFNFLLITFILFVILGMLLGSSGREGSVRL